MKNILIATVHEWNLKKYRQWVPPKNYKKFIITKSSDLTIKRLTQLKPEFIFFPHWSWKIPENVFKKFNCVVFHMTDLPFGRGGTPLQNLLIRGVYDTKITAIKVDNTIDGGPVYLKRNFSIKNGSAEEIYEKASRTIFKMIDEILNKKPQSIAQNGKIVVFKRRLPKQSELKPGMTQRQIYDFIRMLDAPGYPQAYFDVRGYRLELSGAKLDNSGVHASVRIITKAKK